MSFAMWKRDPFFGGCSYFAEGRDHYVRGFYPANEFEAACLEWTASNLPGETFWTAEEAMDASDETFYSSGFVWESEDEDEDEELVAEAEETPSQVWDPTQEAARVAGRAQYYYWS